MSASWRNPLLLAVALVLVLTAAVSADQPATAPSADQQNRLDLMKSKGVDGSITVLPVRFPGRGANSPISVRVAEVVGVLLEKDGLKNVEVGETPFNPTDPDNLDRTSSQLGEFIKSHPVSTDYALYADYHFDTAARQFDEPRAVVVDAGGGVVWVDRHPARDETAPTQESPDPMTLSVALAQRLGPLMGLSDATAAAAKPGKLQERLSEESGLPSDAVRAQMEQRRIAMKAACPGATLLVYRPRVNGSRSEEADAQQLANAIDDAGLCKASAAGKSVWLHQSVSDPNEQKVLWNFARDCRNAVRSAKPDADYVLFADYGFSPDNWQQGFVHLVVCDRAGDWVIVDFQNSHWPDYQNVKPVSKVDCDNLLVTRLSGLLK